MSYLLHMRGAMTPRKIDADMAKDVERINVGAAMGQTLIAIGDPDAPIVINADNINIMEPEDDAFFAGN